MILCCASFSMCAGDYGDLFTIDTTRLAPKTPYFPEFMPGADLTANPVWDFLVGLWDGFNGTFQYDLRYMTWCYKAPKRVFSLIEEVQKIIQNFLKSYDIFKLYDEFKELGLKALIHLLPCYMTYSFINHFLEIFQLEDFDDLKDRLIMSAFSNAQLLIQDVMEIFQCLGDGDFHCVGEDIGQIIYVLIFH